MKILDKNGREVELQVGDRVLVNGSTKSTTYGYVREIVECPRDPRLHGKEQAVIYFPELGSAGDGWTCIDLTFGGRS